MKAYRSRRIYTVEDARRIARRRLPSMVFDYLDGGAGAELTMRANRAAIEAVTFRPRLGITRGSASELSTTVLGVPVSMPLMLSPAGLTRMMGREGDVGGVRAAGDAGIIFTLSSMSGHTMAEVAAAATGPAWFQLYLIGGRAGAELLVDRAQKYGYGAMVVTLDTQIPGYRERDSRHRVKLPLRMNLRNSVKFGPKVALHPSWLVDFARDGFQVDIVNSSIVNTPSPSGAPLSGDGAVTYWGATPTVWEDFAWLRSQWKGPIIAKGITTGEDARRAVDCGVSAIIVSNHGGRQLDGLKASLPALVDVLDAVGEHVEVYVDGGFQRGSEAIRALALGARAVMIGKAWIYGLAAAGQAGVDRVLSLFREDMDRTLRLLGCSSIADLDRSFVHFPDDWKR